MTVEELAEVGDKALDAVYGYGLAYKGTFGEAANYGTAKAVLEELEKGEQDIEKLAAAAHQGWSAVATTFDDPVYLVKPEKKLQRLKLAEMSYEELSEEEKEKDRVVARAIFLHYKNQQA